MIFLIVKQETKSTFPAIIASCLYAATYEKCGGWFDTARVDSLFLFFLLVAIYLVRFKTSIKAYILAGVFVSLSFLTKQTVLIMFFPVMIYCFLVKRIQAIFLIGTTIIIIGGSTLALNHVHDGWYNYYVFQVRRHLFRRDFYPLIKLAAKEDVPKRARLIRQKFSNFFSKDIAAAIPIAFVVSLYYIFANLYKKKYALFYFSVLAGMFVGSLVPKVAMGGDRNNLFPIYAIISVLFGLGMHMILQSVSSENVARQKVIKNSLYLLFIAQFALLAYNPLKQIPSEADWEAGRKVVNIISEFNGEVLVYNHGYLAAMAGKKIYLHHDAMSNSTALTRSKLKKEIMQAIRERKFDAIITDSTGFYQEQDRSSWKPVRRKSMKGFKNLEKYYKQRGHVFSGKDEFWPVTGFKVRPQFIFVPNS